MTASLSSKGVEWQGTLYRKVLAPQHGDHDPSIFETVLSPQSGPPRHIHHREDETFYVVSGDVDFWLEGEIIKRGPGQALFAPRGREHTFRVVGNAPARMLTILTPGGFEDFFAEMAQGNYSISRDMARIIEIGARYNVSFTGPQLESGRQ